MLQAHFMFITSQTGSQKIICKSKSVYTIILLNRAFQTRFHKRCMSTICKVKNRISNNNPERKFSALL